MNIAIILAAGEGTRMKSNKSKVLHKVCGKPILSYIVDASKNAAIKKNIVVVGHGGEEVEKCFKEEDVVFVKQPIGENIPYGTGYAVMQAKNYIDNDSNVIILYGDTPLITENTINSLIEYHEKGKFDGTVLTAVLDDPTAYGRIVRDESGELVEIVEEKDATVEEKKIKEINSGIYCFRGKLLKDALDKINNDNAQGEYYVTDVIEILKKEGYKVGAYVIDDSTEINGINTRVQLAFSEKMMRARINERHMLNGITIIDSDNTYIQDTVKIGKDTVIYPGVILEGNTIIGEDCIIGHNTKIVNSNIKDGVEIETSTILDSTVGEESKIGPYAYLRPNSNIGKRVKIGDFVEVKNSTIGDYSKASHLSYIGDATVGKNVNIGCGVVFVNYNGKVKQKTIVEDNGFVGSNSNLVAPVTVREGGYVAAGSTITDEVPANALSIARGRQVNKEDWATKKDFNDDN